MEPNVSAWSPLPRWAQPGGRVRVRAALHRSGGLPGWRGTLAALRRRVAGLQGRLPAGARMRGIPVDELLSPGFVAAYTCFRNADDLFEASGLDAGPLRDGRGRATPEWDAFVRSTTSFGSWSDLRRRARRHWLAKQRGATVREPARRPRPAAAMAAPPRASVRGALALPLDGIPAPRPALAYAFVRTLGVARG